MSRSATNVDGRKSMSEPPWLVAPMKNPDEGMMYEGPGFSHSYAGGSGAGAAGGEKADFWSNCSWLDVGLSVFLSANILSSCCRWRCIS